MPPLTPMEPELSWLRSELLSIESLLVDVLQRQSLLLSRLDQLQRGAPRNSESPTPGSSSILPIPWVDVARKRRRVSLPLFSPGDDDDPIPTSNSNSPLEELAKLAEQTELIATRSPSALKRPASVRSKHTKNVAGVFLRSILTLYPTPNVFSLATFSHHLPCSIEHWTLNLSPPRPHQPPTIHSCLLHPNFPSTKEFVRMWSPKS